MGETESPLLAVSELSVVFNRWGQEVRAVDGISFSAARGDWIALVGPNGAGKSTLLKALMGLATVAAGSIALHGKVLPRDASARRSAGMFMVHQSPLLGTAPLLTPVENLVVAGAVSRSQARALLEAHGLVARADQPAGLLSGGERQYLAILIATLRRPAVLLLDEPFSALDSAREAHCLEMLRHFIDAGGTIIQITHQPGALADSATRWIALDEGTIVADVPFPPKGSLP